MIERNPGPWAFHQHCFGLSNVVVDAIGSVMTHQVPGGCGMLIAAAPTLLQELTKIADLARVGSLARVIAESAIEGIGEREGMMLADWRIGCSPPRLRVVGVAM